MVISFVLIMGLFIGSFLNVCIYKISTEKSKGLLHLSCMKCGYELTVRDLIPVVSYIFSRGKCRECKHSITIRYPIVEITNALIYVSLYIKYGIGYEIILLSIFTSLLIVIAFIDYETKFVYSSTIYFGIIVGLIYGIIKGIDMSKIPWDNILGAVIGYGVIWIIVITTKGMGDGDIDIAMLCGLFLGVKGVVVTLFIAIVLGGLIGSITLLLKLNNRKSEIAFGPYLAIGAILSTIYGNEIIDMYIRIFL